MKTLILLFTLAISASSFKYQEVTINSARVSETSSSFLYQFDLSRYIATIDSSIDSAKHVIVCDSGDTASKAPRYVHYIPGKRLLVYVDEPKSNTVNRKMWVCYDTLFNGVNSTATFTNNNITNYYGFDRFSGNTFYDNVGSNDGTGTGVDTVASVFGVGGNFNAEGDNINLGNVVAISSVSTLAIQCVVSFNDFSASHYVFNRQVNTSMRVSVYVTTGNLMYVLIRNDESTSVMQYENANTAFGTNSPKLLTVYYNGELASGSRVQTYVNETKLTPSFTSTQQSTSLGNLSSVSAYIGNSATTQANIIDELGIYSDAKSAGFATDRYRMLFDTTFYSVGAMFTTPTITAQPVSDTVQTGTPASYSITAIGNSLQYAWYKQGVATGAITPTYTFTPTTANDNDSIYCIVSTTMSGITVTSNTVRARVFGIDSAGIASFTLYHTGEVDSVHIDGVKATLSAAGTDSVRVAPASQLMVRSAAYTITLFDEDVGYPYVYRMVKGLVVPQSQLYIGVGF